MRAYDELRAEHDALVTSLHALIDEWTGMADTVTLDPDDSWEEGISMCISDLEEAIP